MFTLCCKYMCLKLLYIVFAPMQIMLWATALVIFVPNIACEKNRIRKWLSYVVICRNYYFLSSSYVADIIENLSVIIYSCFYSTAPTSSPWHLRAADSMRRPLTDSSKRPPPVNEIGRQQPWCDSSQPRQHSAVHRKRFYLLYVASLVLYKPRTSNGVYT